MPGGQGKKLDGKVAVVTGAGSGIGQGIAYRFAQEGARLVIADIAATGEDTRQEILAAGSEAIWSRTDVGVSQQVKEMVAEAIQTFGKIDILVNNAAVQHLGPLWELPEQLFEQMMRTNLFGYYACARYIIPTMIQQGKGCILNISSNLAFRGLKRFAGYSATKGGIVAMSRALALECAPYGIRVNCICPGSTITPIMKTVLDDLEDPQAILAEAAKMMPAGRLGLPEDVANLATFLVSDEAEMVVGATYLIDGGASIFLPTVEGA
jgi:NAD(P)-dependent dehydrogenase (short-subunit alcohol dehydrogenase family)